MSAGPNRFYNSIENVETLRQRDLIDLFTYYLTVEAGETVATATKINKCFSDCDLPLPVRTSTHLSEGTRSRPVKFVRVSGSENGYKLERNFRENLSKRLGAEKVVAQTSVELRRLEASISTGPKKDFLTETIDCFEAGADRATIVMCWILVLDHLFEYVFCQRLAEFNSALANSPDKRIKKIISRDDFAELKEKKFIEVCRAADIITNDVRKILDDKLGTRNSCAHPSGIKIKRSKVIDFVDDLITNVVLKYSANS
jgi:hypothetical protein